MDEKMSPTAAVDKATTDVESGQVTNLQAAPLRKLKSRHIQFIALGGTIGTGLFLGIGRALTQAGPLSLLLGYSLTGVAVCAMMQSLGEMATWLPLPGAIPQFCARYVDESLGFAVGWNAWYSSAIICCAEISAAAVVIEYWKGAEHINVAIWISVFIVAILVCNVFAVEIFGEAEFVFASLKILTILGLLILSLIIDLGGVSGQERLGFRYWKDPGCMKPYKAAGNLGRFLGLWSTMSNAAFSYNGVETIAAAAGDTEHPRHNIPKAVRRVFWRILFFYVLGSLALGVLVPYNDPHLLHAQAVGAAGAARSPWVVAINRAGIDALPSIINAVILSSAASSGNALLYIGSRYLYALAELKQAPRIFLRCSRNGVPYVAVLCTAAVTLLTYLSCSNNASIAFTWFQNIAALSGLLTWWSVLIAFMRFRSALAAQNVPASSLYYQAPLGRKFAIFALIYFTLVIVFNGFYAFIPWTTDDFLTSYIGIPIFGCLYLGWKVSKKTSIHKPADVDLWSGKDIIDAAEDNYERPRPQNAIERLWLWIA